MTDDDIKRIALETDVLDPALTKGDNWMTDYGSCKEDILAFANALILMERERIAAMLDRSWLCDTVEEREHRAECAAAIRKGE